VIWHKVDEIWSGVRDALHVLAKQGAAIYQLQQDLRQIRATLDQLLLQYQSLKNEEAAGLAMLIGAEIETEEEREQREKLQKEFEEFQDVMRRLEEV
jgi:chromosome segregation ATPase